MMLINSIVLLLLNFQCIFAIPYLVSLKLPETLETFLTYDVKYPQSQRIKSLIGDTFTIGNFTIMSGNFTKVALERLKRCPLVADISPDTIINAFEIEEQYNCPRHLARLSLYNKLGNDDFSYFYDSQYAGQGVNAYVIDSGVAVEHPEFQGRASTGYDFTNEGSGDTNGHGTHVAGLIGSSTYGAAKKVNIIEVKALDRKGAGSLSTIISAIEFTVNHRKKSGRQGVANLSLGAARNKVLNQAIEAAVKTGLVMVVAAGNSNVNACLSSPASAKSAITVGAIDDRSDGIASFSNWGECVDVFASGAYVASVNAQDYNKPQILSGTSMSAPIVSGFISTLLSKGVKPKNVREELINMAATNRIPRSSVFLRIKTPNRIAYNGLGREKTDSDSDSDSDSD